MKTLTITLTFISIIFYGQLLITVVIFYAEYLHISIDLIFTVMMRERESESESERKKGRERVLQFIKLMRVFVPSGYERINQ